MKEIVKNMWVRALSGAALVAAIAAATLTSSIAFSVIIWLIIGGCLTELYRLAKHANYSPNTGIGALSAGFIAAVATGYSYHLNLTDSNLNPSELGLLLTLSIPLCTILVMIAEMISCKPQALANCAITTLGVIYITLPLALTPLIPKLISGGEWDGQIMLAFFCIMWASDSFAYLAGITMGRHLLIERVSPKKTIEGVIGGVLGSVGVALLAALYFKSNLIVWGGLGLVASLGGVAGDLVESMIKRAVNQKDSGNFLPGHGGWLDRFDSLIFAVPLSVIYLYIIHLLKIA